MRKVIPVLLSMIAVAQYALPADDQTSSLPGKSAGQSFAPAKRAGELLLVRTWDPATGELIAWMPMHRLAIILERLGEQKANFDANEAVTMYLPRRPEFPSKDGAVSVSPDALSFRGRKWVPLESEINLVMIRKARFYIKTISFDESMSRGGSEGPGVRAESGTAAETK